MKEEKEKNSLIPIGFATFEMLFICFVFFSLLLLILLFGSQDESINFELKCQSTIHFHVSGICMCLCAAYAVWNVELMQKSDCIIACDKATDISTVRCSFASFDHSLAQFLSPQISLKMTMML